MILNKSIKDGIIEQAITWSIEMILSGYNDQLWNKIITTCSIDIHIYNPFLPTFLWNTYDQYKWSSQVISILVLAALEKQRY